MQFRNVALIGLAGLLWFASPAAAATSACCDEKMDKACCDMPCCQAHVMAPKTSAEAIVPAEAPARQAVSVWFKRPVTVGRHILQGRYVIEHDNDRMARGEPCTRIYAYHWDSTSTKDSWDSAFIGPDNKERPSLTVLRRALRNLRPRS